MEQRELLDQLGELLLRLRLPRQLGATVRLPLAQLGGRARLDSQLSEHAATLHGRERSFALMAGPGASTELRGITVRRRAGGGVSLTQEALPQRERRRRSSHQ